MSAALGTCKNCEQWEPRTDVMGQCRNRSPQFWNDKACWPYTHATDWCGDHLSKLDDAEQPSATESQR